MSDRTSALDAAAALARRYLDGLDERPVGAAASAHEVRARLGGPLPERGEEPAAVIEALAEGVDPGLVAAPGPRYFGFVTGGSLPAALAADWLVSAWDQCAGLYVMSPAVAAIEEVTASWALDVFGLPATASVGFVTGAQGANTTCLAAARHAVLARTGWDVARDGLIGAPNVTVICGEDAHVTVHAALGLLGLGRSRALPVQADDQGRMDPEALVDVLRGVEGPTIVCAQAGNVSTGAFDPFEPIADACAAHGAWLHVDGAFGLWAAASPALRHLVRGVERADSWGVDAHKWLNVPYDAALAIVRDEAAHRAAMALAAAYLVASPEQRDSTDYVPEASRRARAVPIYAALRSLGRAGLAELIERNCAQARLMAALLGERVPGVQILNDVVLNQVLVRLPGDDEANRAAVQAIQRDGVCWLGGTTWRGSEAIRIAISNWSTTDADIERSADSIAAAAVDQVA
jgi:glutamate/tyrosine decarboxylase-like PLP-dependent enzyme